MNISPEALEVEHGLSYEGCLPIPGGFLERAGLQFLPHHSGGRRDENAESATNPEVAATARLIELEREVYDTLKLEGHLEHLPRSKQRWLSKGAELEDEVSRDFVGAKVEDLLSESGLTQDQLANGIRASKSTTVRFLKGETYPNITTVGLMLRVINKELLRTDKQPIDEEMFRQLFIEFQTELLLKRQKRVPTKREAEDFEEVADDIFETFLAKR